MAQPPILRPYEVVRVFEKFGWDVARQKGSHIIMTKEGHIANYPYQSIPPSHAVRYEV